MKTQNIKTLLALCFLISYCECQEENKCAMKGTCGACIRDSDCVWCNGPFIENSKFQRCEYFSKSKNSSWCDEENIINPKSTGKIIENLPLQSSTNAGKEAVQIAPQRVKLTLRPGEEYELKFKYATAKDYPVDLYYIMDLSASMSIHKQKLSELGNLLSNTMKKLTKNFRLGFGSFVDKVVMPFTSTHPETLKNPCSKKQGECAPPYSFKNHLALNEDANKFTNEVKRAKVSGNTDFPEGGFDALMQAIVCQENIGWRSKARRLIVFSTDASFHIAGDGKLAGIVLPNDGKCHLENNEYTHDTILDYPSIAHISHKVKEHNINLIFAVVKNKTELYTRLKNRIGGSEVGILSDDSSNIVDLVSGVYDKIVDSVKISDNADSNIEVKYYSSCRNTTEKETNECHNLKVGVEVDFKAVIKVLNCPEKKKQTFEIKPGALDESLTVEVEMLCDCDCEKQGIHHAPECHQAGSLQCGICSCDSGKFGTNCQCDGLNSTSQSVEDESNCRMNNNSEVCSGLGTCKCNTCDCPKRPNKNEIISGKFCECTNYSCQRISGALCSNNGVCKCGKCICFAGYDGDACECRNKTDTCIADSGEVCNNHGTCSCGSCICDDGYNGQFCQECFGCEGELCQNLKDCVEYEAYKTGIYNEDTFFSNCSMLNITLIEKPEDKSSEKEKMCRGTDNEGCTFYFKYYYDEMDQTVLHIFALKEKICPAETNVLALVAGIIGSILLAGLILLLLWKGLTTVHDRREYAKFETERNNAQWNRGENPLFKNPTTTFKNPTFSNDNNY